MAQQQNPYYGTGFYQPSGTYVQPQQMTQQQQQAMQQQTAQAAQAQYAISQGMLPLEQSYIENILRLNKGKQATVVMNVAVPLVHNLIQVLLKQLAVTISLLVNRNQENAIYY